MFVSCWASILYRMQRYGLLAIAIGAFSLPFVQPTLARSSVISLPQMAAGPSPLLRDLLKVEDLTETVAESELQGATAQHAIADARVLWPSVRKGLVAKDARPADLAQADSVVAALAGPTNLRKANDVTGALVPFFPLAGERLPVDVHTLDYLGRSLKLDAASSDWTRAAADANVLRRSWMRLRPIALARGAKAVVAAFDRDVRAARDGVAARRGASVIAAGVALGTDVDDIEKAFGS